MNMNMKIFYVLFENLNFDLIFFTFIHSILLVDLYLHIFVFFLKETKTYFFFFFLINLYILRGIFSFHFEWQKLYSNKMNFRGKKILWNFFFNNEKTKLQIAYPSMRGRRYSETTTKLLSFTYRAYSSPFQLIIVVVF